LLDWGPQPKVAVGWRRRSFQTWTEEYSAASLYSLPLLIKAPPSRHDLSDEEKRREQEARELEDKRRDKLAKSAVEHLRRAMSSTPSWHAAERRDWVLSEDPDLDGLRASLPFKHFEATFFPSPAPTPRRPRRASRWEMSRYTNALLAATARRWEAVWHQRRDLVVAKIDPHVVIQWSKDEAAAWQIVDRMARDYKHWPARYELIDEMKAWSASYGFEPLDVAVPRFVRDNGSGRDGYEDYDALCKDVADEVTLNENRLTTLLGKLDPITGSSNSSYQTTMQASVIGVRHAPNPGADTSLSDVPPSQMREYGLWWRVTAPLRLGEPPLRQFERLQDELSDRDFWHRAAPRQFLQGVCDVHAAMWQRLHEWLEESADDDSTGDTDFTCAVAQAARLSETSGVRWVRAVIARRIQRLNSAGIAAGDHLANGIPAEPT
jgi:hypothetical protein